MEKDKGQLKKMFAEFLGKISYSCVPTRLGHFQAYFHSHGPIHNLMSLYESSQYMLCAGTHKKRFPMVSTNKMSSYWLKRQLVTFSPSITFQAEILF